MTDNDTYKTIKEPAQGDIFKDKNSKFYGFSFPIENEDEVKNHLENIKALHYSARHWCYAYQLGVEKINYRANDDGEPNNSAGMPIYGQIQSYNLTNILIVVVRYYGGIKLGVGGLINAYRTSAQMAIEASSIIEKTINKEFKLNFEYKNMSRVMRLLKEKKVEIIKQTLEMDCQLLISVRKNQSSEIFNQFKSFFGVTITEL